MQKCQNRISLQLINAFSKFRNKEVEDNRNMRRENKLYSYEDQLMEMELRKVSGND